MGVENSAQIIKYLDDAALKLMYSRLNSRFVVVNELPAVNTLSPDERKPIYLLNDGVGHVPYFIKDGEWEPAGITAEELEEKADRVEGAHAGNLAVLDADGNLADANAKPSDFATAHQGEVAQEAYDLANSAYQKPAAGIPETDLAQSVQDSLELADTALQEEDIGDKADKVSGATEGHFASLDSEGNLADAGVSASDFSKVTASSANGKIKVDGSDVTVYTHPTAEAAEPSAVQVGRDASGHVVLGDALTKGDVGLDQVDNTSDADKPISTATQAALNKKVTAVAGKGLSTNDFTDEYKEKIDNLGPASQSDWEEDDPESPAYIQHKPTGLVDDPDYHHTDNNYTSADKSKLGGIEAGAQVNVKADWEAASGSPSEILHKPELAAVATTGNYSDLNGTPNLADVATTGDYDDLNGKPELAEVATTGNYSDLNGAPNLAEVATSGDYGDLENTPELATVATTGNYSDLNGKPNLATVATSGDYGDLENTPNLASVATTGNYSDLNGKPNLAEVATTGDYGDLENTPNLASVATTGNYSDLNGKPNLSTVATTGDYNDLENTPTIPSVDQDYNALSTNAQSGTAVAQAISAIPGVTVDQTYDATSANAQSGTAVAEAIATIPEPDQHYGATSTNAQSGTAVAEAIAAIPEPTVDQSYDATSANAQSGVAVSEAIGAIPVPTVDQTYDATSTNAQSGVAVASAISAIPVPTVDQTYDATSTNAQSGVAVASAISAIPAPPTVDQTYDATSTNAQSGVAVAEAIADIQVDQTYDATSTNAQSGVAVASAISAIPVPTVDQTYDATSTNAQSGVAVASAISAIPVPTVDQTYDATSTNAQSGVAVASAISAIPVPTVDQTYDATSTNAQSGVAVASAISGISVDEVPPVGSTDNGKVLTASYSGGTGSYAWAPAGGGGGGSYTAGEAIDITNDTISFTGIQVDTSYQSTLPKPTGDGTLADPLSLEDFTESVETTFSSFNAALVSLANQLAALGSTITLKGEGTASDIGNYMQNAQVGDAYIATSAGNVWSKNVVAGDMVVKLESTVSVLSTSPNLSEYAKITEMPTVVPGANIVVTPTIVDGHTQYMITAVGGGGGGGSGMAYQFASDDARFSWTQTPDDPNDPTIMTETLNVNLPKFVNVTSMPGTLQANTYYFVYEE